MDKNNLCDFEVFNEKKVYKYKNKIFIELFNANIYGFSAFVITYILNLILYLLLKQLIDSKALLFIINFILLISLPLYFSWKLSYNNVNKFIDDNRGEVGHKKEFYYKLLIYISAIYFFISSVLIFLIYKYLLNNEVIIVKIINIIPYIIGFFIPIIYYIFTIIHLNKINNDKYVCKHCGRLKSLVFDDNDCDFPVYSKLNNIKCKVFCKYCTYNDSLENIDIVDENKKEYVKKYYLELDNYASFKIKEINAIKKQSRFFTDFLFILSVLFFEFRFLLNVILMLFEKFPITINGKQIYFNESFVYYFDGNINFFGFESLSFYQIIFLIIYLINSISGIFFISFINLINIRSKNKYINKVNKKYYNELRINCLINNDINKL